MTTTQLALVVLLGALSSSWGFPMGGRDKQQQQASWDDVNVVAHGLLQLGQALKEHVDKSKAQMREVNAGLRSVDASLQRLERDRERQEEQDRERQELRDRLDRLEKKVEVLLRTPTFDTNSSDGAEGPFVQVRKTKQKHCSLP